MLTVYEIVIKNQNKRIITRRTTTDYINACQYFSKICEMYNVPPMTEDEYVSYNIPSRTLDTNNILELYRTDIYEAYDGILI